MGAEPIVGGFWERERECDSCGLVWMGAGVGAEGKPLFKPGPLGVAVVGSWMGRREGSVTDQMRALWSAEQVARCRTSGERRTRVMYVACAWKEVTGIREVSSWFWSRRQM